MGIGSWSRQTSVKILVNIPMKWECTVQMVEGLSRGHENGVFGLDGCHGMPIAT